MKNDIPLLDNLAEVCTDNLMYRSKVSTLRAWNRRLKTKTYLTNNLENRIVLDNDFVKNYVKSIDASLKLDKAPLDLFLYKAPDQFIKLESWSSWVKLKRVEYKKRNTPSIKPNWATPNTRDYIELNMKIARQPRKDGRSRIDQLTRQLHHLTAYKGRVNPRWVETLMGLPVGWCMVTCKEIET